MNKRVDLLVGLAIVAGTVLLVQFVVTLVVYFSTLH